MTSNEKGALRTVAKRGRRPGPTQTRDQILEIARAQFAERGYNRTTLRSVAEAADVHPALLHHYFRSKQQLYSEALDLPVDPWEVIARLLTDTPRDQLPDALVRHFVSTWRDPEAGARMRARTRRTLGEPGSSGMSRTHLESVVIPRFSRSLGVPELQVAAAFSQLIGLTLADTLMEVRQLHEVSEDELVALVAPTIDRYFTPPTPKLQS